jgi:hypothetical protein
VRACIAAAFRIRYRSVPGEALACPRHSGQPLIAESGRHLGVVPRTLVTAIMVCFMYLAMDLAILIFAALAFAGPLRVL